MVSMEISGYYKRLNREQDDKAYFAWLQGAYNRSAYHAKKYPHEPEPRGPKPITTKAMTEEQMKSVMRGLSARGR